MMKKILLMIAVVTVSLFSLATYADQKKSDPHSKAIATQANRLCEYPTDIQVYNYRSDERDYLDVFADGFRSVRIYPAKTGLPFIAKFWDSIFASYVHVSILDRFGYVVFSDTVAPCSDIEISRLATPKISIPAKK